uniref:DEAD/DEAH box helicase n=1 Tax=Ignavibacterium album TaxID=591197 RepID=A0A7V2ZKH8_9BACT
MNIFEFRNQLISDYETYIKSFITIKDPGIQKFVEQELEKGLLWPEALVQLNPSFEKGKSIDDLVSKKVLHPECSKIFRIKNSKEDTGKELLLHKHQEEAIRIANTKKSYVLTTGTGSGKSLTYIIPIVNEILVNGSGKGIKAIIVYPMNALANSQEGELKKFIEFGYPDNLNPVTFGKYTGQEDESERDKIRNNPPDILLTNFVMLELILTRTEEKKLRDAAKGLKFLVLDELHTYRGRQGADVALLVRRVRNLIANENLQCIGTSATLSSSGTLLDQKKEISKVASLIFGSEVNPENVITESLELLTNFEGAQENDFVDELKRSILNINTDLPNSFKSFLEHPLSIWLEINLGIDSTTGEKRRSVPKSITGDNGLAKELSNITKLDIDLCKSAIEKILLQGFKIKNPYNNLSVFAFKLHQFISKGDTVYGTLEPEDKRFLSLGGQYYSPNDPSKILIPFSFCRECGKEFYSVYLCKDGKDNKSFIEPRALNEQISLHKKQPGFIYLDSSNPWPDDEQKRNEKLPDDWTEIRNGKLVVRQSRKEYLPKIIYVETTGEISNDGMKCYFFPSPFRFCPSCGVSYGFREHSDFAKLSTLSSEGRSTATTILTLSAIRSLRKEESIRSDAKKLLSFTDNRQDASLQAGHFNDFIEIGILRGALYKSVLSAGEKGISHEELTNKIFDSIDLPKAFYLINPNLKFGALIEADKAFRNVLGYRLYRDLKRGWRVTSPNLEQCGLLKIDYPVLEELCKAEDEWKSLHPVLKEAGFETRIQITKALLDFMRRELAIKVDYLDPRYQEQIKQMSNQYLIEPWAIDEQEKLEYSAVLYPRPQKESEDSGGNIFLTSRGGFGQYLRRSSTFPNNNFKLSLDETDTIIKQLLNVLVVGGLVEVVRQPEREDDVPGYQLPASAMVWKVADGSKAYHDVIRVPFIPDTGGRTNKFFIEFYKNIALELKGIEAREHTAQVDSDIRKEREELFKEAKLPILFCSPTMELGVDIKELNVVNLRNVPPTPANYAQRSGRAGRSGQPALVFTYCSSGSSHDQYFFRRQTKMVAGYVSPPRIDLSNEDLVRSHIHSIWLTESNISLGKSLTDVLNVSGENPSLEILDSIRDGLTNKDIKLKTKIRAENILKSIEHLIKDTDWYNEQWLDNILSQIYQNFEASCNRWRNLYKAALKQAQAQDIIIRDATRSSEERNQAEKLRKEAESQLALLTDVKNVIQSDFYSYRYFASEGFLPGYNFPRLPLSAYIPARTIKKNNEYLSRPRFLAISEFGPRSVVYHEGSRYLIHKVILPVAEDGQEELITKSIKRCDRCGYIHYISQTENYDHCEFCGTALPISPLRNLFRMQNVVTKRKDKINSDEEERQRFGYDLISGIRFAERDNQPRFKTAVIKNELDEIAKLTYGSSATIWRINLGWRRRKEETNYGFILDLERGYWAKNQMNNEDEDDPMSGRTQRVIPYVEDMKNCLLFEPKINLDQIQFLSLQYALKNSIQSQYELEDSELAVELLPNSENPRMILFYESAEGGAGILKQIVENNNSIIEIAKGALEICHFDPQSGQDLLKAPNSNEDCTKACYDCLLNYSNQIFHKNLDRYSIKDFLEILKISTLEFSPVEKSAEEHFMDLLKKCDSELEKEWLKILFSKKLRLPTNAQKLIEKCRAKPDFIYLTNDLAAAIYIDGPPHDFPDRQIRDKISEDCLSNYGYKVIRFHHKDNWLEIFKKYPSIFGKLE